MHGFAEGKTTIGLGMAVTILLAGWFLVVVRGPDGTAVLVLLGSWYSARRGTSQLSMIVAGVLLVAGISSGLALWPWGLIGVVGMVCAGLVLPRPLAGGDLEKAISTAVVLLGLLILFSSLSGGPIRRLIIPALLMAGWWMSLRLVAVPQGRRLLRMTGILVWCTFLVWLYGTAMGASGFDAERRAHVLLEDARTRESPRQVLDVLNGAVSIFPWSPSVWAEIGAAQYEIGRIGEAFDSFERGYAIRPRKENPCLWGVVETARTLNKTHILAQLIEDGVISSELVGSTGRIDVAIELWRRRDPQGALRILGALGGRTQREREIAGWLAEAVGQDSTAISTLEPIVASGNATGETIHRLAVAYDRQGLDQKRQQLLTCWGSCFPNHLNLADWVNRSVPGPCTEQLAGGGLLLGNAVRLLGWDTSPTPARAGETLAVRICWVATKPLRDMVIILHLDAGMPPTWTSRWAVGELIVDTAEFLLPENAPEGGYRIFTGLWDPRDEESRLRPEGASADLIPRGEKRIPLGMIEVVR
jgi:hypothetical protein